MEKPRRDRAYYQAREEQVIAMYQANKMLTLAQIAEALGVSQTWACNLLNSRGIARAPQGYNRRRRNAEGRDTPMSLAFPY